MKSGIRNDALLNYNSLTEQMIFEKKGKKLAIRMEELRLCRCGFYQGQKIHCIEWCIC